MTLNELREYFDRHHVDMIRTHATLLDGSGIGQYIHRDTFLERLETGQNFSLACNETLKLQPDLSSLITDGTDADLGHIICDLVPEASQTPCARSTLKRLNAEVEAKGFQICCEFQLQFYLFDQPYQILQTSQFETLIPYSQLKHHSHDSRTAHQAKPFMKEVLKRLSWRGISWQTWQDQAGAGQLALSLSQDNPIAMADKVIRVKEILFEVALEQDMAVTFMPNPVSPSAATTTTSYMPIQHSLQTDRDPLSQQQWLAGLEANLDSVTAYLMPTPNAYHHLVYKSATAKLSCDTETGTIKHDYCTADINPYLALSVILASGLSGLNQGLNTEVRQTSITANLDCLETALQACAKDEELENLLGSSLAQAWLASRRLELSSYRAADQIDKQISQWEYQQYFSRL